MKSSICVFVTRLVLFGILTFLTLWCFISILFSLRFSVSFSSPYLVSIRVSYFKFLCNCQSSLEPVACLLILRYFFKNFCTLPLQNLVSSCTFHSHDLNLLDNCKMIKLDSRFSIFFVKILYSWNKKCA